MTETRIEQFVATDLPQRIRWRSIHCSLLPNAIVPQSEISNLRSQIGLRDDNSICEHDAQSRDREATHFCGDGQKPQVQSLNPRRLAREGCGS